MGFGALDAIDTGIIKPTLSSEIQNPSIYYKQNFPTGNLPTFKDAADAEKAKSLNVNMGLTEEQRN